MKYIWMEITKDKYELPVAVADTCEELADMCGVSPYTVRNSWRRYAKGKLKKTKYIMVNVTDQ